MRRVPTLALIVSSSIASAAAAQTTVALTKPDAEFAEPFTRVASLRELAGGKVIVSDTRDKIVQMVDFSSETTTKIGREGQGPGEYSLPATLFALPDNQTWLHDLLGRRFLPIDPRGTIADPVPMPGTSSSGRGGMFMIGGAQGSDAQGRIYFQAPPINPTDPNALPPDSLAVLRWNRVSPALDTVAWIAAPKPQVTSLGGGARIQMRIGVGKMFEPQQAWGVSGDGAVVRVIPSPYHVVWYGPGARPAAGPVVPYTPLPVTQADKDEVIEARKRGGAANFVVMGRNGGRATSQKIELPDPEFADSKPPFRGQSSVSVAPDGEVWVERTQPAGAKQAIYDVFDRSGRLVRKVTLNPRSRVVGFGTGTVYVVRQDEDDLEYLQRFPKP